jgi:hypothetical protein
LGSPLRRVGIRSLRCSPCALGGTLNPMLGPTVLPLAFGVAGWIAGEWAGLIVGVAVGLLVSVAVMVGAIWWSNQIGALLELDDARANAPSPPGFRRLTSWVYDRTLK